MAAKPRSLRKAFAGRLSGPVRKLAGRVWLNASAASGRMRGRPLSLTCMFHLGRSSALGELLDADGRIRWDSEIHQKATRLYARGSQPAAHLVRCRAAATAGRHYGWECKHISEIDLARVGLDAPGYVNAMRGIGLDRAILLRRKNILRQIVSSYAAVQRGGRFHNFGGSAERVQFELPVDGVTITLAEPEPLRDLLGRFARAHEEIRAALSEVPLLELTFEDDIKPGVAGAYERVCRFMGLEPGPVEGRHTPSNPFPLDQMISNMDEVRRHLAGTPFAWMAEPDADGPPAGAERGGRDGGAQDPEAAEEARAAPPVSAGNGVA